MTVDPTSLERIRNATFPVARRGYEKKEVEKFLQRLADWLETGGGDQARSDTVKRELERVGQRTGAILAQAEESAQQIRGEAEDESKQSAEQADAYSTETRAEADTYSEATRKSADEYSTETRDDADEYAADTRKTVDDEAAAARNKLEQEIREGEASAQATAQRIVDEGTSRRSDIEAVISDLVRRRDTVLDEIETLTGELTGSVTDHRPAPGSDPFDLPDELDPAARSGDGDDADDDDDPGIDHHAELDEADDEADDADDLDDNGSSKSGQRKRSGGVKAS